MAEVPKKRGRPPGKRRRPLKKWDPQKWEPVYDHMVVLSTTGKSNIEIAEITGYAPQHVSNVLTSPTAAKVKAAIIEIGREKLASVFDDRVKQVADLTISRTHQALRNDDLYAKNPFSVINAGLAVTRALLPEKVNKPSQPGEAVGDLPPGTTINIGKAIFTAPQVQQLTDGLKKLREVKDLHALPAKVVNE